MPHSSHLSSLFSRALFLFLVLQSLSGQTTAQNDLSTSELKKLSVEDLMNIKVTLVSRTPVSLSEAASAIQVLTNEDIRRSGATTVPEALRLIPNIQVGQLNSGAWIVGVRGFSTIFANKLLVMIDGRNIYTPLFGGVIWDLQNLILDDIDRIEVVSGPGASLWGANAVNGVINIITKKSQDTQGGYVSAAAGTFVRDNFEARYGGKLGKKASYRIYGLHSDRSQTTLADGTKNSDKWGVTQLGFRMDFEPNDKDAFSVQGDFYSGDRETVPNRSGFNGQNLNSSWTRKFSENSDMIVSLYFDRYYRDDVPGTGADEMNTVDLDFQHRFPVGKKNELLWGTGYRFVRDNAKFRTDFVGILPQKKGLDMFNAFVQDEISFAPRWKLTLGTKLLHNVYTGFELQPSVRTAFAAGKNQTLWAAVSRAVRTPSRFDRDYHLPVYEVPPPGISIDGGPDFMSEKLVAFELGYRIQPNAVSTFSLSTFYNIYDDLYSVETLPGTMTYQIMNGSEAESWGFEFNGAYQVVPNWRLRGGYTFFDLDLRAKDGHNFNPDYLANDAKHRFVLQSITNLPWNLQFDITGRYMGNLKPTISTNAVPDYFTFDVRIAWVMKHIELSVVGQNLAKEDHLEFGLFNIPRSVYGKITARF